MSSRLAIDPYGRLIAEGACPELHGLRWLVVGDTVESAGTRIFFIAAEAQNGRLATGRERLEAQKRAPYRAGLSRKHREQEVPDDELDEKRRSVRTCLTLLLTFERSVDRTRGVGVTNRARAIAFVTALKAGGHAS